MEDPRDSGGPGTLSGDPAPGTRADSRNGANRDAEVSELEAANAALREALTTIAHELRTPLASIVAYNDLLLRNKDDSLNARALEQLTIIRRNAGLLDFLIQDLGEMARLSSGALPIRFGIFDASELVREVCESVRPFFDANVQTLHVVSPPPDTWVTGDSVRLHQVVTNLLTNASKFSPPSSQVDLAAEVDSSRLMVQVVDRGIGIDRKDHDKLFASFFRAGDCASDGMGMGLHIAQLIVEAHGGELSVKSNKGRGTTMAFTIPRTGPATPGSGASGISARKSGLEASSS